MGEESGVVPREEFDVAARELAEAATWKFDDDEIATLVLALGKLCDTRAQEQLASLARTSSHVVRRAIAESLPMTMIVPEESNVGINALLRLFEDENDEVRDWAVCSLGRTLATTGNGVPPTYDTPAIRAALSARLDDPDQATRAEACAGLALRHVAEVVPALKRELDSPTVGRVPVLAAEAIGSSELLDSLVALRAWWQRDPELLERAITACAPSG